MKTVLVLALDGVLDSTLAITLDTLRTAEGLRARAGKTAGVRTLVANHRRTVRTGGGMRLDADLTFAEVLDGRVRPHWLVVPGLGLTSRAEFETRFAQKDALAAMNVLRETRGKVGASCSAVFLLAEAGLLGGRRVTST
jgi:transcriptional regulator GlxA family with amidase domain